MRRKTRTEKESFQTHKSKIQIQIQIQIHYKNTQNQQFLPRKFKVGVTVPGDNSIDIYTQDLGESLISHCLLVIGHELSLVMGLGLFMVGIRHLSLSVSPLW